MNVASSPSELMPGVQYKNGGNDIASKIGLYMATFMNIYDTDFAMC